MKRRQKISFHSALVLLVTAFGAIFPISGCEEIHENIFDGRISEGVIHYEVTFPYSEESGLMANMLPDEMTMKFKDDRYVTELSAGMGMFRTKFICDNEERNLYHLLHLMKEKSVLEMNEKGVKKMLKGFPGLSVVKTIGVDTIAGYPCKRGVGIYHDIEKPPMTIYYTDDIRLDHPNWCNQFQAIDGVLLYYEVERFGKRMRLKATSVKEKEIKDKVFSIEGYEKVSLQEMTSKMQELAKTFN